MSSFSYITQSHPSYIEDMYRSFRENPDSVDPEYRKFFEGFDFALRGDMKLRNLADETNVSTPAASAPSLDLTKEFAVFQLIEGYIKRGHLLSTTNPILPRKKRPNFLDLSFFGLSDSDLTSTFQAGIHSPLQRAATLADIIAALKKTYCANIGLDITSINDQMRYKWLTDRFTAITATSVTHEERAELLKEISHAVIFERFLQTKYVGQKRFSLEGSESLIVALNKILRECPKNNINEVVIGMAHRGRLNVFVNVMQKSYEEIFAEFESSTTPNLTMGSGDVKYHVGYHSKLNISGSDVHVHLCPNPSHLEAVDPVVLGYARAHADAYATKHKLTRVMPVLIHGDASVAGQGIIYETLQMNALKGYKVGGTMHIVTNNQIGFTTPYDDTRSTDYCTAIAAAFQAPVLHVNGDDVEAVIKCVELATEYRNTFGMDIFIDIVGYRRHGHNEGDDPKFTQPLMYNIIDKHPNVRDVYVNYLSQAEPNTPYRAMADQIQEIFWNDLQNRLDAIKSKELSYSYQAPESNWSHIQKASEEDIFRTPKTAITKDRFTQLFDSIMRYPQDFVPLKKVEKIIKDKITLLQTQNKIDWATGELLAYASMLADGHDVRLSGEDVKRGTFSHRHACIYDERDNREYNRLSNVGEGQGTIRIYNSLLSEYGVLGYEYGYACSDPNNLVIWEAQFGDFANGAQIIIDQFISGGEEKWNQMTGLVLLLPHGYEGQGPEHSSARVERFLQLCAENNMLVTNITTAANLFHVLRRQLTWNIRKPLINFSPKANLRHPGSYSLVSEFTDGAFHEIIDCPYSAHMPPSSIRRVLLCSGKIYFDLAKKQADEKRADVAIVRIEQLYPLPTAKLEALLAKYAQAEWIWVQEEPHNMGAVSYLQHNWEAFNFGVISRNPSAATSIGYNKTHLKEQHDIVQTAFSGGI